MAASAETRQRLDLALVERGLAPSRSRARDAIRRGHVTVDGVTEKRPAAAVGRSAAVAVDDPALQQVSRAGWKLAHALDTFRYDPAGRVALDIGASTGGFTEVLLARGAAKVFAVDVGHGQLHPKLAADPRVVSLEGRNARDLTAVDVPQPVEAIVADVSFIPLKLALPAALGLAAADAWLVALVKPQFEVGPDRIGKGGIVRDPAAARSSAAAIAGWLGQSGWRVDGITDSPIAGGDGNREFLIGARRD
ncbi:MAG TPA: TlyA family RNA methyltransferase [Bauldia sp.]|nr:TlyA family RNA methyltransferase [Bauldia sp.]